MCPQVDTTCKAENICRTCSTKYLLYSQCSGIESIPNATVSEYGNIKHNPNSVHQIKAELWARGPVVAGVNGKPLHEYHGGVYKNETEEKQNTHAVSIVGWGVEKETGDEYWIVRNRYVCWCYRLWNGFLLAESQHPHYFATPTFAAGAIIGERWVFLESS